MLNTLPSISIFAAPTAAEFAAGLQNASAADLSLAQAVSQAEGVDLSAMDEAGLAQLKWRAGFFFAPRDIVMEQALERLKKVPLDRVARPEARWQSAAILAMGGRPAPSANRAAVFRSSFEAESRGTPFISWCDNCTSENRRRIERLLKESGDEDRVWILKALVHTLRCEDLVPELWPGQMSMEGIASNHVANIRGILLQFPEDAAQHLRGVFRTKDQGGPERRRYAEEILAAIGAKAFEPIFHVYLGAYEVNDQLVKTQLSSVLLKITEKMFAGSPSETVPSKIGRHRWKFGEEFYWGALNEFFMENAEALFVPAALFLVGAEKQNTAKDWIGMLFERLDFGWRFRLAVTVFAIDRYSLTIEHLLSSEAGAAEGLEEAIQEEKFGEGTPLLRFLYHQKKVNPHAAVLKNDEAGRVLRILVNAVQQLPPDRQKTRDQLREFLKWLVDMYPQIKPRVSSLLDG